MYYQHCLVTLRLGKLTCNRNVSLRKNLFKWLQICLSSSYRQGCMVITAHTEQFNFFLHKHSALGCSRYSTSSFPSLEICGNSEQGRWPSGVPFCSQINCAPPNSEAETGYWLGVWIHCAQLQTLKVSQKFHVAGKEEFFLCYRGTKHHLLLRTAVAAQMFADAVQELSQSWDLGLLIGRFCSWQHWHKVWAMPVAELTAAGADLWGMSSLRPYI